MAPGLAEKIEINADMGEGLGQWKMGPDEELMPLIDAANIACGFHAGDPSIMLRTARLCRLHGVKAGAHPGLPDLLGFGRRRMDISPADLHALVLYQVGALKAILAAEGLPLAHVKPHGELFFCMQRDEAVMRAVLTACATFAGVPVYGCENAAQRRMCEELGVPFQGEVYVDIDYEPEGGLVPRARSREVTPALCYERAAEATARGTAKATDGREVDLGLKGGAFSICLHSDVQGVLENAKLVRKAVDEANKARLG
ncbi:Glycoside hydrolase/deacetylase, beta/alpha-barrel [Cordyceps fumosorosea ARSEF 2679]|uniref:Glycoside hydrolase/deacetylase, beta/alpha-barrel n=1 Tax=Cordyceps fumosorosea (strain ARSEF 2679) TaxID=1081104 RepID=A0A167N525_CORFA|nr:Glycoside hydrolase/deacetylase, beta/alpha-barrel [Cordyceps fumosorosea ARSEF 2679]OAA55136.1 Glycoside hydrolase/deacetylase, beta/alpha-barrel [Cordyceps fumosorosea ARSEF 2679]